MIGTFIAVALLPLVSVGFMIATRVALAGTYPTPRVFVDPLRGPRSRTIAMIQLGVGYALATLAIMWLSDLLDGGAFDQLMEALPGGQTTPEAAAAKMAADPRIELGLLLRFALAALLSVPFWHAPALVHWDGHGPAKALFSSTLACWRNKGAFAIYSLSWFGVIMAIGIVSNLVFALLGLAAGDGGRSGADFADAVDDLLCVVVLHVRGLLRCQRSGRTFDIDLKGIPR